MSQFRTIALFAALSIPAASHADTAISIQSSDGSSSDIAVRQGVVNMDLQDNETLFDSVHKKIVIINHKRRSYFEMDPESMKQQMTSMSETMNAQMEQMLAQMPENQREMMKQQMQQMMGGQGMQQSEPAPAWRFVKTGESKTVNGFACRTVDVFNAEKRVQSVCVNSAEKLGIGSADAATLKTMFGFMREISQSMQSMFRDDSPEPMMNVEKLGGLPVLVEDASTGDVTQITRISDASLPADKFAVPKGYKKSKTPDF